MYINPGMQGLNSQSSKYKVHQTTTDNGQLIKSTKMNEGLTHLQIGNRHMVRKEYEQALREFLTHARELPAEAPRAYVQAAECLTRTNTLTAPVEVEPGIKLIFAGDRVGAAQLYRKALAIDPRYFPALRGLAQVLDEGSAEQVRVLEEAVGLRRDPLLVEILGGIYEKRGSLSEAAALYQSALADRPNDRYASEALGRVQRSMK